MQKIKILAICGKAGAGKDTLLRYLADNYKVHEIISCTTRPPREGEKDGVNYYFLTPEQFAAKVINDDMLESTEFNGWFYGTSKASLDVNNWNVGVFNPEGIEILMENFDVELQIIYVVVNKKERLIRQLNREEEPDVDEIIRRYQADENDFKFLTSRFPFFKIMNSSKQRMFERADVLAQTMRLEGKTG